MQHIEMNVELIEEKEGGDSMVEQCESGSEESESDEEIVILGKSEGKSRGHLIVDMDVDR